MRVHDRMPVILATDAARRWIEPGPMPAELLVPYPAEEMQAWRVGDAAKSSRIEPHAEWQSLFPSDCAAVVTTCKFSSVIFARLYRDQWCVGAVSIPVAAPAAPPRAAPPSVLVPVMAPSPAPPAAPRRPPLTPRSVVLVPQAANVRANTNTAPESEPWPSLLLVPSKYEHRLGLRGSSPNLLTLLAACGRLSSSPSPPGLLSIEHVGECARLLCADVTCWPEAASGSAHVV